MREIIKKVNWTVIDIFTLVSVKFSVSSSVIPKENTTLESNSIKLTIKNTDLGFNGDIVLPSHIGRQMLKKL